MATTEDTIDRLKRELDAAGRKRVLQRIGFDFSDSHEGRSGWTHKVGGPQALGEGKNPNFAINLSTGAITDHGSGANGWSGDTVAAVQECRGCSFSGAMRYVYEHTSLQMPQDLDPDRDTGSPRGSRPEEQDWSPFDGTEVERYPYRSPEGDLLYQRVRFRPPEGLTRPDRPKKFLPYTPASDSWSRDPDPVLYRLPQVLSEAQKGEDGAVVIVEGEKDVHSLENNGLPYTATTSGAAGSWKERYAVSLEGARVVVIPDNDDDGESYAKEIARTTDPKALEVRIVELHGIGPGEDVSDWLQAGGTMEELLQIIAETDPWTPQSDLAEAAGDGQSGEAPDLDLDPWQRVRATYTDAAKRARVEASQQVIDELKIATDRHSGECYVWDPDSSVMEERGGQRIGELLVRKLQEHHSRHERKEIQEKVELMTARDSLGFDGIPVQGADLFLDGSKVRAEKIDPDRAPLNRSSAAWDPDADTSFWERHLEGVMTSEQEIQTLQEFAGYGLLHWSVPFHKCLFMIGPTASGKSTTLEAIQSLYGKIAHCSPQQLVNGRFGSAELEGAWTNIRSDINGSLLKDVGLFKELIAGDKIYIERKFEQGYSYRPTAKHIYSANQLPDVNIDDDAFYRRILLVSFPQTIPKDQRIQRDKLDRKLDQEKDAILRWAVEGLQRLMRNSGFTNDLSPAATRRRWEGRSSSIGRFKAAMLDVTGDNGDIEVKDRLYSFYSEFCEENGLSQEGKQTLTSTLKKDPKIDDAQRTPRGAPKQFRCYTGVRYTGDSA